MIINKGGMLVEKGLYWSPLDGQRVSLRKDGMLPGDGHEHFLRISPAGLLFIAPLFGLMYVLFLPLFGVGVFIISGLVSVFSALASIALKGVKVCGKQDAGSALFTAKSFTAFWNNLHKKEHQRRVEGGGGTRIRKGGM
jgi:hypothetical protein